MHHHCTGTTQTEEKNKKIFKENQRGSSSTLLQDSSLYDGEARNDSGPFQATCSYRHHVEPRVKLYVPREASFPVPLKYIDVNRMQQGTREGIIVAKSKPTLLEFNSTFDSIVQRRSGVQRAGGSCRGGNRTPVHPQRLGVRDNQLQAGLGSES